jgi:hypothetical protein
MKITDISQLKDGMKVNYIYDTLTMLNERVSIQDGEYYLVGYRGIPYKIITNLTQNKSMGTNFIYWQIVSNMETVERTLDDVQAVDEVEITD